MIRSFLILLIAITFAVTARSQHLTLAPESTDFGAVPINSARDIVVKAYNRSSSPITIQGGLIRQSLYFEIVNVDPIQAAFPPYTLSPDDSIVATIEFTPDSIGAFEAILSYTFADGAQQEYHMKGTGTAKSGLLENSTVSTQTRIWPNPATTFVDILPDPRHDHAVRVELRNLLGQVVASTAPTGATARLDCSGLNSGSYLVTEYYPGSLFHLGTVSIIR